MKNYALPMCTRCFGAKLWIVTHLANDWLAGTWFFLYANAIFTFGSFLLLIIAVFVSGSPEQIFVWMSG
jgi:hypothetical protein